MEVKELLEQELKDGGKAKNLDAMLRKIILVNFQI